MLKNRTLDRLVRVSKEYRTEIKNNYVVLILLLSYIDKFKVDIMYHFTDYSSFDTRKYVSFKDLYSSFGKTISKKDLISWFERVISDDGWINLVPIGIGEWICRLIEKAPDEYFEKILSILAEDGNPIRTPDDYEELVNTVSLDSIEERESDNNNGISYLINRIAGIRPKDKVLCIGVGNGTGILKNRCSNRMICIEYREEIHQRLAIGMYLLKKGEYLFQFDDVYVGFDPDEADIITYCRPLSINDRKRLTHALSEEDFAVYANVYGESEISPNTLDFEEIKIINYLINSVQRRAVLIVSNEMMTRNLNDYGWFRNYLLEQNYIDTVVHLPKGIFRYTQKGFSILVIDKKRSKKEKNILFVDLANENKYVSPKNASLRHACIDELADLIKNKTESPISKTVSADDIAFGTSLFFPKNEETQRNDVVTAETISDEEIFEQLNSVRDEINNIYINLGGGY